MGVAGTLLGIDDDPCFCVYVLLAISCDSLGWKGIMGLRDEPHQQFMDGALLRQPLLDRYNAHNNWLWRLSASFPLGEIRCNGGNVHGPHLLFVHHNGDESCPGHVKRGFAA